MKTTIIRNGIAQSLGVTGLALVMAMSATPAAFAAITNTATANGAASRGTLTPPTAPATVPVQAATKLLSVVKSIDGVTILNGADNTIVDAADIVTYRYVVTNTGTATLANVTPVDTGPTFNGTIGENIPLAFTFDAGASTAASAASVKPGETAVFTSPYVMSSLDYLRGSQIDNGVANSATATASGPLTTPPTPSTTTYDIPANPLLSVAKAGAITAKGSGNLGADAEVGDTITYTYTVTNTGSVVINGVTISDVHEDGEPHATTVLSTASMLNEALSSDGPLLAADSVASTDAVSNDGTWSVLQPGAVITFSYAHTVTQAEFDAQ